MLQATCCLVYGGLKNVFSTWKYIMVSELAVDANLVEKVAETNSFMCFRCYKNYEKICLLYNNIKTSLEAFKSTVFILDSPTDDLNKSITGQKRREISATVPIVTKLPRIDGTEVTEKETVAVSYDSIYIG